MLYRAKVTELGDRRTISRRDGRRARDRGTRERTLRAIEARLVDEKCALTHLRMEKGWTLDIADPKNSGHTFGKALSS